MLYILSKGLVVLNSKLRSEGEVWGEDFVLEDTTLIRPVAGYAMTYIEVLSLTREDFMGVIERRRFSCPQLQRMVRRYCVRIAVYRGILAEAQRLKQIQIKLESDRLAQEESKDGLRNLASKMSPEETFSLMKMALPGSID